MYKEDVDPNTVFEYLWHIIYMLARKGNFFGRSNYYDDFSTYLATQIYFRIKNPKQFDDNSDMKKIKSILNYIKSIIYPRKVTFEQEYYSQVVSAPIEDEDVEYDVRYSFSDMLSESVDEISRVEFDLCLQNIPKTIKTFLKRIPYYHCDKVLWNNIYISCLLTFLDSIVICKKDYDRITSLKYKDIHKSIQSI